MRIDWSQEDTYGQASSPESGDLVQVGWSVIHYKMVYRLNLGPRQDVPRHILAMGLDPGKTAMALLYEHVAQCQATDTEELTLP